MIKGHIDGLVRVLKVIKALSPKERRASVIVGYTQSYALPVHERVELKHRVGQAKYLETPARNEQDRISKIVTATYKKTHSMPQSLLMGGLYLQRQSQRLVPVLTGALKGSAFTRNE